MADAVTKREDGKDFLVGDYAYTPSDFKPSTWKLRLTSTPGGDPDPAIVGAAAAALGKGFRGQKVDIPSADLAGVKSKVRAAWKKANPDKKPDEMPSGLNEAMVNGVEISQDEVRSLLQRALANENPVENAISMDRPWIVDIFDTFFAYNDKDITYKRDYTLKPDGVVLMGAPVEVIRTATYVPVTQPPASEAAVALTSEYVPLIETGAKPDGVMPIKIIAPIWGSSGYYSPECLKAAAPLYKAGTKMFWNHPTVSESKDRPERDLRDLAGVLVSDGRYEERGVAGPGIYADSKVFEGYRPTVGELGPHIGVSHRAMGKAVQGEAEGRKGMIVEKIAKVESVDFVTEPGAGGQVLALFEAARGKAPVEAAPEHTEVLSMTEVEIQAMKAKLSETEKALSEARAELAKVAEKAILGEARQVVVVALGESKLPEVTRARMVEALVVGAPVKDGKLDTEALKTRITEAVKVEGEYIAKVVEAAKPKPTGSGQITGMGGGSTDSGAVALQESYKQRYIREGKPADEAERMAKLAVGR